MTEGVTAVLFEVRNFQKLFFIDAILKKMCYNECRSNHKKQLLKCNDEATKEATKEINYGDYSNTKERKRPNLCAY